MPEPKRSSSKIIPSKKVVVIELVGVKSSAGIEYITEKKQEIGKIVAIGEGKKPVEMKIGDVIVFRKFGEDKLLLGGKEFLFVTFPDILAVLK